MKIFCSAMLLLAGFAAAAQAPSGQGATAVSMPPTPLLLAHAADLTLTSNTGTATGSTGAATGNGVPGAADCALAGANSAASAAASGVDCAALMKEDGLRRSERGTYTRAGGGTVAAAAWEFGDATGAYSAYTFFRTELAGARVVDGDARTGKAHETSTGEAGTLAWAGTAVLWVGGRVATPELAALIAALPKVSGRAGLAPLLPTLEPADGRGKGSERYSIGPVGYRAMGGALPNELLGWNKSAEILTGANGKGLVTLLLYPTPQIAGDRGRAVEAYINQAVQTSGPAQFGTVKMRRLGPLVGLTTGAMDAAHAKELLDSLRLNQEVSFDKPMPLEFHAEIQKTYSLMQSIALFCGLGLVACVLLALFLGGARAGIRVLQGKPAATEPEFLTINLRNDAKGILVTHRQDGSEIP